MKLEKDFGWWIEHFWSKIIVALAILIGTIVIQSVLKKTPDIKRTVTLGFGDHSLAEKKGLEQYFRESFLQKANGALSDDYRARFDYDAQVIGGGYEQMENALKLGRIDMGFVPPFTYIFLKAQDKKFEAFEEVGFKFPSSGIHYYSGMVIEKALLRKLDPLKDKPFPEAQELINAVREEPFIHFILSSEEKSTSTRIIPSLFLLTNDNLLNTLEDPKRKRVHYASRTEMIELLQETCTSCDSNKVVKSDSLKPDRHYIGFLSSDDWVYALEQKILDRHKFEHIRIPIPIPYDPVLVHKDNWENRYSTQWWPPWSFTWGCTLRSNLIEGLRSWVYRNNKKENESWEELNKGFIDRVSAGVVVDAGKNAGEADTVRFLSKVFKDRLLTQVEKLQKFQVGRESLSQSQLMVGLGTLEYPKITDTTSTTFELCNRLNDDKNTHKVAILSNKKLNPGDLILLNDSQIDEEQSYHETSGRHIFQYFASLLLAIIAIALILTIVCIVAIVTT